MTLNMMDVFYVLHWPLLQKKKKKGILTIPNIVPNTETFDDTNVTNFLHQSLHFEMIKNSMFGGFE